MKPEAIEQHEQDLINFKEYCVQQLRKHESKLNSQKRDIERLERIETKRLQRWNNFNKFIMVLLWIFALVIGGLGFYSFFEMIGGM